MGDTAGQDLLVSNGAAMAIRVLVVDDPHLFAEAIGAVLKDAGMNLVASVGTGADAIGFLEDHVADVILLDIGLQGESGLRTGKRILERWPRARIVGMSGLYDQHAIVEALHIGFHAYVMKDTPTDELVKAIGAVGRGEQEPGVLSTMRSQFRPDDHLQTLTPRERDVLDLLVEGADGRTVAARLDMTAAEVRSHVQSILEKLHVDSRSAAITKAISEAPDPSADHPHLTPMTDDQVLAHLRYMHARGIAPFSPVDFDNLRELHAKLHRQPPPSPA
jgi:two-component system, NarL family, nitrate/nitrite response regulator NarL